MNTDQCDWCLLPKYVLSSHTCLLFIGSALSLTPSLEFQRNLGFLNNTSVNEPCDPARDSLVEQCAVELLSGEGPHLGANAQSGGVNAPSTSYDVDEWVREAQSEARKELLHVPPATPESAAIAKELESFMSAIGDAPIGREVIKALCEKVSAAQESALVSWPPAQSCGQGGHDLDWHADSRSQSDGDPNRYRVYRISAAHFLVSSLVG